MAVTRIVTKNTTTPGKAPGDGDILRGELALNLADQKLYSKDQDDNIFEVGSKTSGNDLQQVTDAGNTTTNDILINSKIELKASDGSGTFAGSGTFGTSGAESILCKNNSSTLGNNATIYAANEGGGTLFMGGTDLKPGNQTVEIRASGYVKIGGLPSAPNIELNADGTANFQDTITVGPQATSGNSVAIQNHGAYGVLSNQYSSGAFIVGYGVKGASTGRNDFISSSALNVVRVAYTQAGDVSNDIKNGHSFWGTNGVDGAAPDAPVAVKRKFHVAGTTGNVYIGQDLVDPDDANITLNADGSITADGDVKIGGLPSAPNIELKSDGSGTFAGEVLAGGDWSASAADTQSFVSRLSGASAFKFRSNTGAGSIVDFHSQGADASSIVAKIMHDGSASFAGNIQTGGQPSDGTAAGARVNAYGNIMSCNATGGNALYLGYLQGNTTETSRINADGSAEFAGGQIVLSDNSNVYAGAFIAGNDEAIIYGNGKSYFAGDMSIGGLASAPNISLNADGSSEYKGIAKYYGYNLSSPTGSGVEINNGLISVQRPSGNTSSSFVCYSGTALTATISADGRGFFGKELIINRQGDTAPGVQLLDTGEIKFSSPSTLGAPVLSVENGSSPETIYNYLGTEYSSSGWLLCYGCKGASTAGGALLSTVTADVKRGALTVTDTLRFRQGATQTVALGNPVTTLDAFVVSADGAGWFRGSVTANGNVLTRNVELQLDPENPNNYVSTTNADGETESVYNGPTMELKETLLAITGALKGLKNAAASATTCDELRSAIETALADV